MSYWPKAGDKMRFLNRNGYDVQREHALKVMNEGDVLTVKECRVGNFDHSIVFEELDGSWNGVMFERAALSQEGAGE